MKGLPGDAPLRGAAAILLHREDQVWLGQRGDTRFLPGYWVFPGGGCEPGENHLEAARREVFEEAGLELPLDLPLKPLDRAITPAYSLLRYDCLVYAAELPPGLEPNVDGYELEIGRWFEAEELLALWARGQVQMAPPTVRQVRLFQSCQQGEREWPEEREAFALPPDDFEWLLPITEGVDLVPLRSSALPPASWTNSALLGLESFLVVDPGGPDPTLLRHEIDRRMALGHRCQGVLLTHQHPDHLEGYLPLGLEQEPLYCHELTAPLLPSDFPQPQLLADGEVLILEEGFTVKCHFTPGHAPGHLALEIVERSTLFAADLVSSLSSIVLPQSNGDLSDYMDSLRRMQDLGCSLVIPSHGPPYGKGSDPFGKALAHRQHRETQIISLLEKRAEAVALADIRAVIYKGLAPELEPAAEANVRHHLKKLRKEGRAKHSAGGWLAV